MTAGSPINLACVGEGSPAPEVTESSWSKNGSPLPTADLESGRMRVLTHGSLFISQARLEDRGQYTCTLKNSVGLKSQLSSVTVEGIKTINLLPYSVWLSFCRLRFEIVKVLRFLLPPGAQLQNTSYCVDVS